MKEKDLCLHCGGTDIRKNVEIRTNQNHSVGPRVKGPLGFLSGGSNMFCDICRECGTLTRIFVDDPDKNFVSGEYSFGLTGGG